MSHKRSTFILSFFFSQTTGIGARVLPLLGVLVLVTTGCVSTHEVTRDTRGYSRVTGAATGETVRVHLRDGRTLKLERLYVGNDSASGVTRLGTKRTVPTSAVQEVQIVDRSTGALQGGGIGGALPLTIGIVRAISKESDGPNDIDSVFAVLTGGLLALPGALVGALVGGVRGQRDPYRFSPASPEVDSAQAVFRTRLPANRRRAAEQL